MKTLKQALIVFGLTAALLTLNVPVIFAAEGIFPLPGASEYGDVPATTAGGTAQEQFAELVWGIVQNLRYIIGAVAIAMIVYAGFRMVIGKGQEEIITKQRMAIFYAIIGLVLIAMAGEAARIFSVSCTDPTAGETIIQCKPGGFLKDPNALIRTATLFDQRTQIIITFIKYIIGSIAVLMVVRNGLRLVTMSESDEALAKDKKNLIYSAIGLVLIIMADTAVNNVFYKLDLTKPPSGSGAEPMVDPVQGVKEIVGFTNIVVSFVGPLAVLALLIGGGMYITAGGQEEKMNRAKKLIFASIIGIVVIYGAFAIVSTFIGGQF